MNDTPLAKILEWFNLLDHDIQIDLLGLCGVLHYDKEISEELNSNLQVQKFIAYLTSDQLGAMEIVTRVLFTSNLIDFAINGRDSEEDWSKTMDRNLDIRNRLTENGHSTKMLDDALNSWEHRKYKWINISNSWYELKNNHFTIDKLDKWFMYSHINEF